MRNDDKLLDAVIDLGLGMKRLENEMLGMKRLENEMKGVKEEMKVMKELMKENSNSIKVLADTLMTILPNHEKRISTLEMRKVG